MRCDGSRILTHCKQCEMLRRISDVDLVMGCNIEQRGRINETVRFFFCQTFNFVESISADSRYTHVLNGIRVTR